MSSSRLELPSTGYRRTHDGYEEKRGRFACGETDQIAVPVTTDSRGSLRRLAEEHRSLVCGMNLDFLRGLVAVIGIPVGVGDVCSDDRREQRGHACFHVRGESQDEFRGTDAGGPRTPTLTSSAALPPCNARTPRPVVRADDRLERPDHNYRLEETTGGHGRSSCPTGFRTDPHGQAPAPVLTGVLTLTSCGP